MLSIDVYAGIFLNKEENISKQFVYIYAFFILINQMEISKLFPLSTNFHIMKKKTIQNIKKKNVLTKNDITLNILVEYINNTKYIFRVFQLDTKDVHNN